MAFRSPSPQLSPTLVGGGSNLAVKSERRNTPSPTHAPLNKRDRRRNALADRLMDLSTHFSQNRDGYFRQQLQMLQTDMNLIMRADPYQDQPLDDYGDDVADLVGSSLSGTVPNSTSAVTSTTTNGVNGPVALQRRMESDEAAMSGRVYASFVEEVNHCMEERDAALTQLANEYERQLQDLRLSTYYKIRFAQEEHRQLSGSLRDRLVQTIGHKRTRLVREKEHLDLADSAALLLHPSQFSITHPSSPGGTQSNRKTRNTRLRPGDYDDVGAQAAGDGPAKRKRKTAPEDADGEHALARPRLADFRTSPHREAHPQTNIYTIERLFTEKELSSSTHNAAVATAQQFAQLKSQAYGLELHGDAIALPLSSEGDDAAGSGGERTVRDGTSAEDASAPAPEMDRSANPSQHATRSGRNGAAAGLHALGDAAASQTVTSFGLSVPLHVPSATLGKNTVAPAVPSIAADDGEDDLRKMDNLIRGPSGATDRHLLEQVCTPLNALAAADDLRAAEVTDEHTSVATTSSQTSVGGFGEAAAPSVSRYEGAGSTGQRMRRTASSSLR